MHDLLARLGIVDHTKNEEFIENTKAIEQELWCTTSISRSEVSSALLSFQKLSPPPPADYTYQSTATSSVTRSQEYEPLVDDSQQWPNLNNGFCSIDQVDLVDGINCTDQTLENALSSPLTPDQLFLSCVTNDCVNYNQHLDLHSMGNAWN